MSKTTSNDIITTTQKWFDKAPSLPENVRELLVTITPWVALIFGIIGILGSIAGLGALSVLSPFSMFGGISSYTYYGTGFIASLVWLVASVLLLAAYPGTKARKLKGWNLLFWSELVHFIGSLIALSILSGIIGALIGFYLIFQIKSYYK